jgi:hypothetical protein
MSDSEPQSNGEDGPKADLVRCTGEFRNVYSAECWPAMPLTLP